MPTITLFNPKGGCGKSTAALVLATELAERGASVAILDGDPNPNLFRWAEGRGLPTLDTEKVAAKTSTEVLDLIDDELRGAKSVAVRCRHDQAVSKWVHALSQRFTFVICDPEGTANAWVTFASQMSDLVVVPLRPSPMDGEQMLVAVDLLEGMSGALRRQIPFRLLFTCCGSFITRDEDNIRKTAARVGYQILPTRLAERAAYRAMVGRQMTLAELATLPTKGEDAISGVDKARQNAAAFCRDVIEALNLAEAVA